VESKGFKVMLENGIIKVMNGSMIVMKGIRNRNLCYLKGSTVTGVLTIVVNSNEDATKLWYIRLGHAGEKFKQVLGKQDLLNGAKTCKLKFCEHRVLIKKMKVKFDTTIHCIRGILDYVRKDVWGPSKNASLRRKYYFVSFIDDYSRRKWVYTMSQKSEV